MDKTIYLNELYDYYGELFTEKQRDYFEDYYFNNLSLSEIAENNNVSRNAVHNQLKIVENKLESLEKTLKLIEKKKQINKILKDKLDEKLIDKINEIL